MSQPKTFFVESRRIWILRSSIIMFHVKNSHIGCNIQLQRHNASVLQQEIGEMKLHQLIHKMRPLLKQKDAPYIIRCGGIDIGQRILKIHCKDHITCRYARCATRYSCGHRSHHSFTGVGKLTIRPNKKVRVRINSHVLYTKIGLRT